MALFELPPSHEKMFATLASKYQSLPPDWEERRQFINMVLRVYRDELERQHGDWSPHLRGRVLLAFLMGLFERCGLRIEGGDVMH